MIRVSLWTNRIEGFGLMRLKHFRVQKLEHGYMRGISVHRIEDMFDLGQFYMHAKARKQEWRNN
jgi:hypothetical protein